MKRSSLLLAALALVAACAQVAPRATPDGGMYESGATERVRGTATYRERIALPENAVLEVRLEDVSKADVAAVVIGRTVVERPGNPPFAFEIAYDASRIDPRHRYTVRARILVAGRLMFTTDQHYPVLTSGRGNEVDLLLRRVGSPGQAGDEPLENTYWKLTRLGETPVRAVPNQREAHFILHRPDRRVSGSGGCNRVAGGYELEGDRLTFGRMAVTMMACAEGAETERAFLAALQQVRRAKITQQRLELLDSSGGVVARFEAVHLR